MINNLYDYIVEQFQHETDIVRIIDHIPEFPGKTGNHELKMMEIDGICIEAITNSSFPNHILYKIPIETDSFLEYQKKQIFTFLNWFFRINKKQIIAVDFYKKEDNNPTKWLAYLMIELA